MKNSLSFIGIIVGVIFGAVTFFVTSSILFTMLIIALTVVYFSFILTPRYRKYKIRIEKYHECYNFINNFIISLSIKKSILGAFESVENSCSDDYLDVIDGIKELPEVEKIKYLNKYFPFHIYRLFCDVIILWSEEGGDILKLSNYVVNQSREYEDYLLYCKSVEKRKLFELITLWVFTIVIVVVLKVSLTGSLQKLLQNIIFQASIFGLFILVLVSIELIMSKIMKLEIKGWSYER